MKIPGIAFALVLTCCSLEASAQTSGEIEGVRALINQGRPVQEQVPAGRLHVAHSKSFPEATLVGFFTGSRSVILGDVIIDGKVYTANSAATLLLQKAGWEKASPPEKQALALAWLDECVLAFGETLLRTAPAKYGDLARIKPVALKSLGDGSVRVIGWVQEDPGLNTGTFYRQIHYIFGPQAQVVRSRIVDRFYQEP